MPMYRAGAEGARLADGRGREWVVPPAGLVIADGSFVTEGSLNRIDASLTDGFVLIAISRQQVGDLTLETKGSVSVDMPDGTSVKVPSFSKADDRPDMGAS